MGLRVLSGATAEGERRTLHGEETPRGPGVRLELRTAAGRRCRGTGARSTPLPAGQVVGGVQSSGDADEPATWLLELRPDVRAVVVHLSDGTREDLRLVDDPHHHELRWAVLAHPRHLDVHRVDAHDADGAVLPLDTPASSPAPG